MFVRTTRVEKGSKTYHYAQLVESYRQHGKPRQRVIASLGKLSELEVENIRVALKAAKEGDTVIRALVGSTLPRVCESLDYLPIAVVLEMSRRVGIARLLASLLDRSTTSVATSDIVLALVANRLVAPCSKLSAVRWFDRTALPELLGVERSQLNNSRLHRALDALDSIRPELQLGLAEIFREPTETGRVLFIDVSDTWFEGKGPKLAERHKTKEGAYKKKVGIVLTVNKRGQPLRWEVVAGRRNEGLSMKDMARQLRGISWMQELPVVFDRAMGKPKHLGELADIGIRFVTMLTKESFTGYAWDDLCVPRLASIEASSAEDVQAQAAAIHAVKEAGFTPVGRRVWAKDLGVRRRKKRELKTERSATNPRRAPRALRAARQLLLAEEATQRKATSGARYRDVAESMGLSLGKVNHLCRLMKLDPQIRDVIREGRCGAPLDHLEKIGALPPDEQLAAIQPYVLASPDDTEPGSDNTQIQERLSGPSLRVILAFDPVVFTTARAAAHAHHVEIREAAERMTSKMAEGRKTSQTALKELAKLLEHRSLTDCYEIVCSDHAIEALRREKVWERRRRTDGVRLFALHPDLTLTPEQALELYSAKNAVEADFRVIKSCVRIRPVHHNTDHKVRAHVDLCVLALAVERALDDALPTEVSAGFALEELETVRLIDVAPDARTKPTRVVTRLTDLQRELLDHLGMLELATPPPP